MRLFSAVFAALLLAAPSAFAIAHAPDHVYRSVRGEEGTLQSYQCDVVEISHGEEALARYFQSGQLTDADLGKYTVLREMHVGGGGMGGDGYPKLLQAGAMTQDQARKLLDTHEDCGN